MCLLILIRILTVINYINPAAAGPGHTAYRLEVDCYFVAFQCAGKHTGDILFAADHLNHLKLKQEYAPVWGRA